jgi:hypothetical protein
MAAENQWAASLLKPEITFDAPHSFAVHAHLVGRCKGIGNRARPEKICGRSNNRH